MAKGPESAPVVHPADRADGGHPHGHIRIFEQRHQVAEGAAPARGAECPGRGRTHGGVAVMKLEERIDAAHGPQETLALLRAACGRCGVPRRPLRAAAHCPRRLAFREAGCDGVPRVLAEEVADDLDVVERKPANCVKVIRIQLQYVASECRDVGGAQADRLKGAQAVG